MMRLQPNRTFTYSEYENRMNDLERKLSQRIEVPLDDVTLDYHKILLEILPIPIFYKDTKGVYTGCNKAFEELIGKKREEIIGKTVYDMAPLDIAQKYADMDRFLFENPKEQTYTWQIITRHGEKKDVVFKKAPIFNHNGVLLGLVGIIMNAPTQENKDSLSEIHEVTVHEESIEELVITDPLTGLFNRKHFLKLVEHEIPRARRYQISLSLILFEIENFGQITDQYGVSVGDQILEEMSRRVRQCARATDILARTGDSEFGMLAISCQLNDAINLTQRLRKSVEDGGFLQSSYNIACTINLGVAELQDRDDVKSFFQRAYQALDQAKEQGARCICPDPVG